MDQNTIILICSIVGGALLVFGFTFFYIRRHKKDEEPFELEVSDDRNAWKEALGGYDNILEVELKGSRLTVKLKDNSLLSKEKLHELGTLGVIESEDKVTIVIRSDAEKVFMLLK